MRDLKSSEKGRKEVKRTVIALAITFAVILVASFFAGMFNTSFYKVDVDEIEFSTPNGTLSGLLYMPKGAGKDDPRPVIITTHGYLNHKEMQDAPAVEMSRRGYIVLALDMYEHGDSKWNGEFGASAAYGTFWPTAVYDAVQYVYEQPYTLKDAAGNAYTAVSGHSMGGASALHAMYLDEYDAVYSNNGVRKIYTGIAVGADFYFLSFFNTQKQYEAAFGSRTVGIVAGHYDEFFFAEKPAAGNIEYKDYVSTTSGKSFLGIPAEESAEQGKFYDAHTETLDYYGTPVREAQTGKRVIYTPDEPHAFNTLSVNTAECLINFYNAAFEGFTVEGMRLIDGSKQIWMGKEIFNLFALLGFFAMIIPLASLLLKLPVLRKAVTEEYAIAGISANAKCEHAAELNGGGEADGNTACLNLDVAAPQTKKSRIINRAADWTVLALTAAVPAALFAPLMNAAKYQLTPLWALSIVFIALGLIAFICGFIVKNAELKGRLRIGGLVFALIAALLFLLVYYVSDLFVLGKYFNQPATNMIITWAVVCSAFTALILAAVHFVFKKPYGMTRKNYGITFNPVAIASSLAVAIVTVLIMYGVLWAMQGIFGVDFRFWTTAVKTFRADYLLAWLKYVPFFFMFFIVSAAAVNAGARGRKGKYAIAVLSNILGLVLWMVIQYGALFSTGKAPMNTEAIPGILLLSLIPCLAAAAVYSVKMFEKTNNVWLPAFLNSALFTMILCASTTMYFNVV